MWEKGVLVYYSTILIFKDSSYHDFEDEYLILQLFSFIVQFSVPWIQYMYVTSLF